MPTSLKPPPTFETFPEDEIVFYFSSLRLAIFLKIDLKTCLTSKISVPKEKVENTKIHIK